LTCLIYRITKIEKENKNLQKELSKLRSEHSVELEHVRRTHELKLENVHERVKQALDKKEENLRIIKEQYEGALKRADHLQLLLQTQRKELVK